MDGNQIKVSLLILTFGVLGVACSQAPIANSSRQPSSISDLPNTSALKKWKEVETHALGEGNLDSFAKSEFDCADKNLYPTHPQEDLKIFHRLNSADYDKKKLDAFDDACLMSSKVKKGQRQEKLTCARGNIAVDAVLSDTYSDSCGHRFRGFWQITYLKNQETQNTLSSKGRTHKPMLIESQTEPVLGSTTAVPFTDFLFLSPLFPEDGEKINQLKVKSESTHSWNEKTLLFEAKSELN